MGPGEQGGSGAGRRNSRGQFLPGVSGNPAGRRKRSVLAEIERQLDLEGDDGRRIRERVVEVLISAALGGSMHAMDLLLRRVAPESLVVRGLLSVERLVVLRDFTGRQIEAGNGEGRVLSVSADKSVSPEESP